VVVVVVVVVVAPHLQRQECLQPLLLVQPCRHTAFQTWSAMVVVVVVVVMGHMAQRQSLYSSSSSTRNRLLV
jgi:hypothetical protein